MSAKSQLPKGLIRVIKNGTSLTVILPHEFVVKNGIKKGDILPCEITEKRLSVVINQ
jgi:intein/homing endonuclease